MRICSRCNERPAAYTKNLICKECMREHYRKYYETNGDSVKATVAAYRQANQEKAGLAARKANKAKHEEMKRAAYAVLGNKCECCGVDHPKFLTIGHVNDDGGAERRHSNYPRKMYKAIVDGKADGRYRLLCWNCNCGRAMNNGICPHIQP